MLAVALLLFVFGLGLGVLLNSLADNLPPDANDLRHPPRRPRCRVCGQAHAPANWLALAALVRHRGRCEHCGAPRPTRAVVVELAAGGITAGLWFWGARAGLPLVETVAVYLAALVFVQGCLLITVIDIEHRLILWGVVWPLALVAALTGAALPGHGLTKTLLGGIAGYALTLGIFVLAELYARGLQWLRGQPLDEVAFGGGDVNLAGLIGLAVGWPGVLLSLTLAILLGGLYSLGFIVVQLLRRRYTPHSAVPYGPFLVLGALTIYLFGKDFAVWMAGR
ncbi:MAG: prepilin peptidase [Anaerolineales bacterium]|nr:prepilin peptidase [Anaerolineales bacterium]